MHPATGHFVADEQGFKMGFIYWYIYIYIMQFIVTVNQ